MKKSLLILAAIVLLFIANGYSQVTMNTGTMGVNLSKYGRIRLLTPDATIQLDRSSILVGTSETTVFDYANDAVQLSAPATVATPLLSDFEITGSINGGSVTNPPDVTVVLNAYGWTNQAFTIVKYNVTNNETSAINATIGLDIIPELNEEYLDSISYNSTQGVIRYHWGADRQNIGIKLLSATMTSLYSFLWYDGYEVDTSYWNWMNMGTFPPLFISTNNPDDGTVTITAQAPVSIAPGASFNVYYAYALGADEQTMLANIAGAVQKYPLLTVSTQENQLAGTQLKNYPNPVKSTTTFSYQLPASGFVSLKIYDALGTERTTLVNEKQTGGLHNIYFDAKDLASGVYNYRLTFNDKVITNKMLLIK